MAHDPEKLAYWAEHHRNWQSSGLSQRRYCQREGLSFATFDHWRRRTRREAGLAATGAVPGKLTLVPAQPPVATAPHTGIELRTPGGWRILLPATLAPEVVVSLLSRLP